MDVLRTRDGQNNHYQDNGVFNFSGQYSNDPLLDFLTGKMNSFSQSGQQLNDLVQTVAMAYVQDTYHLTPQLVVNFGLRWEPLLPEHDHYNRGSIFPAPRSMRSGQQCICERAGWLAVLRRPGHLAMLH